MKYFSCQPDSHNAFVSFSNCTLSYFSVDSPHYRSLASVATATTPSPSTPSASPLPYAQPPNGDDVKRAGGGPAGPSPAVPRGTGMRHASSSPYVDDPFYPSGAAAAAGGGSSCGAHEASPFSHFSHVMDGLGPSASNKNMSSTRLHIQHVVTLPDCFHSPTTCFGIANHSLFGVDMTVLGTSTGLLALVIPRERTLIYARAKDPAGIRAARQRVRQLTGAATAVWSSSLFPDQRPHTNAAGTADHSRGDRYSGASAAHLSAPVLPPARAMVLEVPTTVTWMRDKPIVLVGYNTGLVEWYQVRVHPSKARDFLDPTMETAYGPPLPANALMQYINNPAACPIEHLYCDGAGDGVWLECTASFLLPESGALTSSDHFPVTGLCVMSSERGVFIFSATQPGAPLCEIAAGGTNFLYCHPCLPFIATLTYNNWASQPRSGLAAAPRGEEDDEAHVAGEGRRAQSPSGPHPPSSASRAQRGKTAQAFANANRASQEADEAFAAAPSSDCVLHVYEFIERAVPAPAPAAVAFVAGHRGSDHVAKEDEEGNTSPPATGPRVGFRVDDVAGTDDTDGMGGHATAATRRHRSAQRTARYRLVPVLQRAIHATLPRYGAYFSLSWKFSFDLELAVSNAEEGWVRVLRLAKRAVGVQRVSPLPPVLTAAEAGGGMRRRENGNGALHHNHHHHNTDNSDEVYHWSSGRVSSMPFTDCTASTDSISSHAAIGERHAETQPPPLAAAHTNRFPYVVVHEHRLRLPLHSLINIEYVSAATSVLEASSLTATTVSTGLAAEEAKPRATVSKGTIGQASATAALSLQTLGATTQITMPTERTHRHATLLANMMQDNETPRTTLHLRGSRWLQSVRGGGLRGVQKGASGAAPASVTSAVAASSGAQVVTPRPRSTSPFTPLQGPPSASLLLKENVLAVQLLQPAQLSRQSRTVRSRSSSHGRSHGHGSSRVASSSAGASIRGGGGASLTNASAAAMAALQTLLRIGAGRFSTCVGMNTAGEIAVVPVDREACTTWHDEGSVFVGLGSTLCAADIVTIQGIERHMKRRMEKGFGVSAMSSVTALRTVAPAHRNVDMEVLCTYVDLMEKAGLAASFGPVPSVEELIAWPTRPSLTVLVRQQCLPQYAVQQLRANPYATDSRRLLLLHVLHWLPCSSRSGGAGAAGADHDHRPHHRRAPSSSDGSKPLPEWWCGDVVRVNGQSTKVDVERAAAVEVLHGRLAEGARMLLDYQSLDVTFTAMATLLSSPDDTLSTLENSDIRVRDAFLRSLSPWMLVMLLYVCGGAQLPNQTTQDEAAAATHFAARAYDPVTGMPTYTGGQNTLLELVRGYRVYVLRHQGIPLWDRIAIATVLEPTPQSLTHALRTHIVPDCNLLQALLVEHGISPASYPHMQEMVDCTGDFQLAACLYARVGAISKAALRLAMTEARHCTAWKLSGPSHRRDTSEEDGEEGDQGHEKHGADLAGVGRGGAMTPPPPTALAGDGAGNAEKGVAETSDAVDVLVSVGGAREGHLAEAAPRDGVVLDGQPHAAADGASFMFGNSSSSTAATPGDAVSQPRMAFTTTASPTGGGHTSSTSARPVTRTVLPGSPQSPSHDPYVTFSPTLPRTRQLSRSTLTSTPLPFASGSLIVSGGSIISSGGGGVGGLTGSGFGSRQTSEDYFGSRRESEAWIASPTTTIGSTAATAEPQAELAPSSHVERLARLLQRSQLPPMAPELCDFGSPLAPIASVGGTVAAQSSSTCHPASANNANNRHGSAAVTAGSAGVVPTAANTASAVSGAATTLTRASDEKAKALAAGGQQANSARKDLMGTNVSPSFARGTDAPSGEGGVTGGVSADPLDNGTAPAPAAPSALLANTSPSSSAPTSATAAAHLHGSQPPSVSPSAQRAMALQRAIFGFAAPATTTTTAVTNPSSFSSASFARSAHAATTLTTTPPPSSALPDDGGALMMDSDEYNPWLWWVEAYRSFLDSEQAFVRRTTFDIDCRRLRQRADDAVEAAESAVAAQEEEAVMVMTHIGRSQSATRSSRARLGRRKVDVPTSIVVVADGTGLRQPLERQRKSASRQRGCGTAASAAAAEAVAAAAEAVVIVAPTSANLAQRCVCGEHHFLTSQPLRMLLHGMTAGLPHCSVCDEVIKPVSAQAMHAAGAAATLSSADGGGTTTALGWCTACMHGGHTNHLRAWFMAHKRCPVDGCSCHCNEESNLF